MISVAVQMLKRNMSIKPAPQRWQDNQEQFDVVIVFEERLMDNLLEGQQPCTSPCHNAWQRLQCVSDRSGLCYGMKRGVTNQGYTS